MSLAITGKAPESESPGESLRGLLDRVHGLASEQGYEVIRHLAAMGLIELDEIDARERLQSLIGREQVRNRVLRRSGRA